MCKVKGSKPFTSARKHLKGTKGESNNRKTQILERRSNRKQMPEYITGIPERGQKYSRANNKLTLPKNANISRKGRHLIEHEPNVEDDTLAALIELDRERIPENISKRLKGLSKAETANYAFCERGEIGLTHLSMCISEDKDQSLAELIARYAEERRIPFVLGAIYIKALISQRDLFYYNISYDGYKKVRHLRQSERRNSMICPTARYAEAQRDCCGVGKISSSGMCAVQIQMENVKTT